MNRKNSLAGPSARLLVALLAGAVSLAACDDTHWEPLRTSVRHFAFEQSCAGDLCGFDIVRGRADRVDAFVAGEHAIAIASASRVSVGISLTTPSTWEGVRFLARCEPGTSLVVEQRVFVWRRTAEGAAVYALTDVTQQQRVRPSGEWDAFDVRFDRRASTEFTQRVDLSIATEGDGDCVVDEVDYGTFDVSTRARTAQ